MYNVHCIMYMYIVCVCVYTYVCERTITVQCTAYMWACVYVCVYVIHTMYACVRVCDIHDWGHACVHRRPLTD